MNWSAIENLVHDNYTLLEKEQVLSVSEQLLSSVEESTKPLQAARITYLLILLELKNREMIEEKALLYLDNLNRILQHEAQETEMATHEHSDAHLRYVLKLADQYFQHITVLAEIRDAASVMKLSHRLRKNHHDELLRIQGPSDHFWLREQSFIKRAIQKHYLFMGFLFAMAVFFAWNSAWNLIDVAAASWLVEADMAARVYDVVQYSLMLVFSLGYIVAFTKYQKQVDLQPAVAAQLGPTFS